MIAIVEKRMKMKSMKKMRMMGLKRVFGGTFLEKTKCFQK